MANQPTKGRGPVKRVPFPPDQSDKTYVKYRRPNKVWIYLNLQEAISLTKSLEDITRAHIPSPERWRLLADIAHDLDMKLEEMLGVDPSAGNQ